MPICALIYYPVQFVVCIHAFALALIPVFSYPIGAHIVTAYNVRIDFQAMVPFVRRYFLLRMRAPFLTSVVISKLHCHLSADISHCACVDMRTGFIVSHICSPILATALTCALGQLSS